MKILIVSPGVINANSGAGRVHLEIAEQYKKAGHIVNTVDYLDFFPNGRGFFSKIFGRSINTQVLAYLCCHANKYDIIEAGPECVIFPKSDFGFKGLLVVRSHGIRALAEYATKGKVISKVLKQQRSFKTPFGSLLRSFYNELSIKEFNLAIKHADLIHCLNPEEYKFFLDSGIPSERLLLIPNGLPTEFLKELENTRSERYNNEGVVCFIAAWRLMKGSKDWREISLELQKVEGFRKIKLLGTCLPEKTVRADFNTAVQPFLDVVPSFNPRQLPGYLKDVKVGAFTSYSEGFGFAILEQITAGIPVVAYNVAGAHQILHEIDSSLLVEPGDIKALVDKITYLLSLSRADYERLSNKCVEVSKNYHLDVITDKFLNVYKRKIHQSGQE